MNKLKIIDLFAGAGGLSYGFESTGLYEVKLAVEKNNNARETYKANHHNADLDEDVTNLDYEEIKKKYGDIDVVIGGPPCQGFSNANRQKNDLISGNNQLVKYYIKAIEGLSPKAFVMENVKMMESPTHKFFLDNTSRDEINKLGVKVHNEFIVIGEKTELSEQQQRFINENDIDFNCLSKDLLFKLMNILRASKSTKPVDKIYNTIEKNLKKEIKQWDELNKLQWIDRYNNIWNDTKQNIFQFLNDHGKDEINYKKLIENVHVIVETNKVFLKMKEIRNHNINKPVIDFGGNSVVINMETYNVVEYVIAKLESLGYLVGKHILNAADYGVPQIRERLVIVGVKKELVPQITDNNELLPQEKPFKENYLKVEHALKDLENVEPFYEVTNNYRDRVCKTEGNEYTRFVLKGNKIYNHIATQNKDTALSRFKKLKPGQNFHDLGEELKSTYANPARTQNTVYKRLSYNETAGTVVNVRKSMWIHPEKDRAITIREAARLQSFPDDFIFKGTKDSQYQQVGNAVPPLMAKAIATRVAELLGKHSDHENS